MRRFFTERRTQRRVDNGKVASGQGRLASPASSRVDDSPAGDRGHAVCPTCFWVGRPRMVARGSAVVESLLWTACTASAAGFISGVTLPVLLPIWLAGPGYSIWRHSRRAPACRQCGTHTLIPEDVACPPAPAHFLFSTQPARGESPPSSGGVPVVARPALSAAEK